MARIVMTLCVCFIFACMLACAGGDMATSQPPQTTSSDSGESSQAPSRPAEVVKPDPVTLGNFYRVENGMTFKEVKAILGDRCELTSEVAIPGAPTTQLITWQAKGTFAGNCNVTFQNGMVVAKAQFALEGPANDTATAEVAAEEAEEREKKEKIEREETRQREELESIRRAAERDAKMRDWKKRDGATFRGIFLELKDGHYHFDTDDGELILKSAELSTPDREWIIREIGKAKRKAKD